MDGDGQGVLEHMFSTLPLSFAFQDVLRFVCKLLRHPFPRVRRLAAENFYVKLLEQPWVQDDHPAMLLLLGNAWDGDVSDTEIQRMAADVAEALDIHEENQSVNDS